MMARVPKKVADRFATTVGAFQRVLADAKDRDVNESDTVTIITDILSDVLGYNKYSDITSEQAIRGTYCDLAVKHDGRIETRATPKRGMLYTTGMSAEARDTAIQ